MACEAEVEQLDVAIRPHHHVLRLDVAVDDLRRVRDGQRLGHLLRDAHHPLERDPFRRELSERRSLDELHRDVAILSDDPGVVDGDDVRMVEAGSERGLAQKAIERIVLGDEGVADDFERDVAAEARIARAIHLAHAAGAELADDLVAPTRAPGSSMFVGVVGG